MFGVAKRMLARVLPPQALFWAKSVKRAVMSQAPLPLQSTALDRYHRGLFPAPENMFDLEVTFYLSLREVVRALTLCVDYINTADIKGDIVEFGTMSGSTARAIATAMVFDPVRQKGHPPLRRLRLFDSFEGLPEITSSVDQASPHVITGNWAKGGCKVLSAAELSSAIVRILPRERFDITAGWFADTVKELPPETRIAMVHFDGDLYQSTIDALTTCFEKGFISKGAAICFDDWNCNQADPDFGERRAWKELTDRFLIVASHSGDYSSAGSKFIVHSYDGMPIEGMR